MLKKFSRYYHTINHLKPIQIRYQVWYRLRDKFFPLKVPSGLKAPGFQEIKLQEFPRQDLHYLGDNTFRFLNLEHLFDEEIDWNYTGYGKLWAYHLNYFDFLNQPEMDFQTGKDLIDNFLDDLENRKEGMEPYPISLRTINWIKFLSIHQEYPQVIIDSLFAHYRVLSRKLEYHLLGNHLLENGFSLLFGAVFFRDEKLETLARKILLSELDEQILDDGGHFELSPMYHVILLQRALDGYNLLLNNDHKLRDVEERLAESIRKMVNWLFTNRFSNGDLPMFNDSTHGQALKPDAILEYAGELGFKPEKVKLSDSGYRKFESGSFEMVADAGPVGPSYQPGHAHCDMLSFVLYHKGSPVIVDRGISTYEKNSRREEERGTTSHNTVMINSEEQSDVWGGFRVGRRAVPEILDEKETSLSATHSGYEHIGCKHSRSWSLKEDGIVIEDRAEGDVDRAEAFLHFHPDVKIEKIDDQTFRTENLIFSFLNSDSAELENYEYCEGFNKRMGSMRLRVVFRHLLKTEIWEKY